MCTLSIVLVVFYSLSEQKYNVINCKCFDVLFAMYTMYTGKFKNSTKFYFLRYFHSLYFIDTKTTSSFFSCISTPLRVHHQSHAGCPADVQFLATSLLAYLQ